MANEGHPDCWSSWAKHVPCHPCTGFSQTFVFPGTAIFTHSLICYHYPGSSPLYCKNLPWRNWTKTFSHLFKVKYLKKRAWEQFYTWRAKSCKNVLMQIYRLIFFFSLTSIVLLQCEQQVHDTQGLSTESLVFSFLSLGLYWESRESKLLNATPKVRVKSPINSAPFVTPGNASWFSWMAPG